MAPANTDIDAYLKRSLLWPREQQALRRILLDSGLTETLKWGKPCYGSDGSNIVILQEMKGFLAAMFFKGALLSDPEGLLHEQGPNSRSAKRMQFTSVAEIRDRADTIRAYVAEAVHIEQAGLSVGPAPELTLVAELQQGLDADSALRQAFNGLTPGRQREYHLHVSSAKQAATRAARVEKVRPRILAGKGLRDR